MLRHTVGRHPAEFAGVQTSCRQLCIIHGGRACRNAQGVRAAVSSVQRKHRVVTLPPRGLISRCPTGCSNSGFRPPWAHRRSHHRRWVGPWPGCGETLNVRRNCWCSARSLTRSHLARTPMAIGLQAVRCVGRAAPLHGRAVDDVPVPAVRHWALHNWLATFGACWRGWLSPHHHPTTTCTSSRSSRDDGCICGASRYGAAPDCSTTTSAAVVTTRPTDHR